MELQGTRLVLLNKKQNLIRLKNSTAVCLSRIHDSATQDHRQDHRDVTSGFLKSQNEAQAGWSGDGQRGGAEASRVRSYQGSQVQVYSCKFDRRFSSD